MNRGQREWLVGTGVIVLATSVIIGAYLYWGIVEEVFKYLIVAAIVIAAFMVGGIAIPLVVGNIILDWLEGEEEEETRNEDPPFQY